MRVLLDECLPRRLKQALHRHDVVTVPEAGWAGKQNGGLIRLAEGRYEVSVTIDQHLAAQQSLNCPSLSVIVLQAPSNRYEDLHPLVPELIKTLESVRPGRVVKVGANL